MDGGTASCSSSSKSRPQLPAALQLHILSFLPPNDRALSGRQVSPDAANGLNGPDHCTASLSQPLPPHAAPWAQVGWQKHVRELSITHKLQLPSTAAASGSEVNLEVAWALLQPSVFPELLQGCCPPSQQYGRTELDPGAAAVKAGHPQLLGWLLRRCPALLSPDLALVAAARHCDLAGLQTVWGLLQQGCGSRCPILGPGVLDAAAESTSLDAVAKMKWVLCTGKGRCSLQESTAAAAARSGDVGRLRWLRDRGCPVGTDGVLRSALEHADLAVVQWLVDEAGGELPQAGTACSAWASLFLASAGSPECMLKWQWLRDRGALLLTLSPQLLQSMACAVIERGRVEGLRGLLRFPGMETAEGRRALQQALDEAEGPRCIATAMQLQQSGCVLTHKAYIKAAEAGDLAMVRWLACEARVPTACMGLDDLVEWWPCDRVSRIRDLLQAVQLLVGETGHQDMDTMLVVDSAVHLGYVPVAQYLLQLLPDYRPGLQLVRTAVQSGCEALLEWLVEQHPGCRAAVERESPDLYMLALMYRYRGILTTLRRLGVPWCSEDLVVRAVREGCEMPALRWLVEQGAPVGSVEALARALAERVRYGSLSSEDAKVVQPMAVRQRHVAAGGSLWEWLRWCVAAAAASQWWAWLWRRLLGLW